MSKIAKQPVIIPDTVELEIKGQLITVKGKQGSNSLEVHEDVIFKHEENALKFSPRTPKAMPLAGTMRSLVNNLVIGVSEGFERKLELVGVGYRAQSKGKSLSLQLGFSHPVDYLIREGIKIETPSQTEVIIRGVDKQAVSQVAAEIRSYRPPEPYKGKGVRYADEEVIRKEAKKQ